MVDYKGFDLAIRALALTTQDIRLDIYGDGEQRVSLEALARKEGVTDRVCFMGWVRNDDLLDAMAKYRGYVFPTLAEANGIAMQEAMMLGLPVIATRWGGPERLADDEAAWYIEPVCRDAMVEAIAAAMTCLARQPERAEDLSRKARIIAKSRFKWDMVATEWIKAAYPCGPTSGNVA
jgi:glycosyltransferase involved in cell wall biosynthesis